MRILSLVTLVSPYGEYGGPVRVAVNQARALSERGHEVRIAGGHRGFDGSPPTELDGVPASLFPARRVIPRTGFAGLSSPALLRWLRRELITADVVHVHAARDLITLPAAALAGRHGVRYLVQTHGMIDPSRHPLAGPLDRVLTRPVLRGGWRVLHLTPTERDGLTQVAGSGLRLAELPNGVPETEPAPASGVPELLYLARLAPRKRPLHFVRAARQLAADFPSARFRMVGPDEGEGAAVRAAIDTARADGTDIEWEGALAPEQTLDRMRRASGYVLPSVDEPYPMSVLEAMSVGLPVVITDSCGLAHTVDCHRAGLIVSTAAETHPDDPDQVASAMRRLLADTAAAGEMGARGRAAVISDLSMDAIAARLEALYQD